MGNSLISTIDISIIDIIAKTVKMLTLYTHRTAGVTI